MPDQISLNGRFLDNTVRVQQSTTVELAINLSIARILGIRLPSTDDRRRQRRSNRLLVFARRVVLGRAIVGQKVLRPLADVRHGADA